MKRDSLIQTYRHIIHVHILTTHIMYTHTHMHTQPLPIKAVRLLLQSVTPLLICQVLVETHICEYFTSALSASQ